MKKKGILPILLALIMVVSLCGITAPTAQAAESEIKVTFDGSKYIYANGRPISIRQSDSDGKVYIYDAVTYDRINLYDPKTGTYFENSEVLPEYVVFGGSYGKTVADTYVETENVAIGGIYGGGRNGGNVTGTAVLMIGSHSVFTHSINGGGNNASVKNIEVQTWGTSSDVKMTKRLSLCGIKCNVTGTARLYLRDAWITGIYGGSSSGGTVTGSITMDIRNTKGTAIYMGSENGSTASTSLISVDNDMSYIVAGSKEGGTTASSVLNIADCRFCTVYGGGYSRTGVGGVNELSVTTDGKATIYPFRYGTVGHASVYCPDSNAAVSSIRYEETDADKLEIIRNCIVDSAFYPENTGGATIALGISRESVERGLPTAVSAHLGSSNRTEDIPVIGWQTDYDGNTAGTYVFTPVFADNYTFVGGTVSSLAVPITVASGKIVRDGDNIFCAGIPVRIKNLAGKTRLFDKSGAVEFDSVGTLTSKTAVCGGDFGAYSCAATDITLESGSVKAIFGSGNGSVDGTASILILGGNVGYVCGGGFGETKSVHDVSVTVADGYEGRIKRINGGGYSQDITGSVTLNIGGGNINAIYGGGYMPCASVSGSVTVNLGAMHTDYVYLGGFGAGAVVATANLTASAETSAGAIFSGGQTNPAESGLTGAVTGGGQISVPSELLPLVHAADSFTVTTVEGGAEQ